MYSACSNDAIHVSKGIQIPMTSGVPVDVTNHTRIFDESRLSFVVVLVATLHSSQEGLLPAPTGIYNEYGCANRPLRCSCAKAIPETAGCLFGAFFNPPSGKMPEICPIEKLGFLRV